MSRLPRFLRHPVALAVLGSVILATSACSGSSSGSTAAGASAGSSAGGGSSAKSSGASVASQNPAAVTAGFAGYRQAVTSKSGTAVADLVSASSLSYIARLRDLALSASRKSLAQESPVDQVTVLAMRAEIDPALLRKDTAPQLVEAAVADGLISTPSATGLTDIKVSGQIATAQVELPGTTKHYPVWLHFEQGKWKYDLSSLLGPAETSLTAAQARVKHPDNEASVVKSALDARYGAAKVVTLYKPLGK